jgi:hypothetical protein
LFGKKNPKPDALEGFQMSTTDPGAPRWQVYGSRAWVPCHYLWSLNIRSLTAGGGGGKGGQSAPFVHTVRADVGLAQCDGPIAEVETLYADERPFWTRTYNSIRIEDFQWDIAEGAGGDAGRLVLTCQSSAQQPFTSIFKASDVVELDRVSPSSIVGVYLVVSLDDHSASGPSRIVLQPLEGQLATTLTGASAGSPVDPASLRRIDNGYVIGAAGLPAVGFGTVPPGILFVGQDRIDVAVGTLDAELRNKERWTVGGIYVIRNWSDDWPTFGTGIVLAPGRWELTHFSILPPVPGGTSQGVSIGFKALDGQRAILDAALALGQLGAGTPDRPLAIIRLDVPGYVYPDAGNGQSWVQYVGTQDQPPDPTLAALKPDPPAHRGIAHMSLANWNLGPHSNIFPRVTALVRATRGEMVASAIKRICGRTMEASMSDVTTIRQRQLLGYSIPAGVSSGQALQPLLAFYGIVMQDRGGVMTFLDERDLPVVTVATRHLNARPPGESSASQGFVPQRIGEHDLQSRVLLKYVEPVVGSDASDGAGRRAPGSESAGVRDTIEIDLKPLVVWPYDAKRRARELDRRIRMETQSGQLRLPPGYMDVLPATILTFQSNNWEQEFAAADTEIAHDTRLRDILPNSVAVMVRFANGQVALLLDDGNGALGGLPAGITASTNTIDYEDGRIDLVCSVDLDTDEQPAITYRYAKQWFMRANKATLAGYDFTLSCDLVTTTTDEPLPPLPRDLPTGLGGALGGVVPLYRSEVLDMPALYPNGSRAVWIGLAVAPNPGSSWRGAVVYQSPNGVDRWVAIGQVQQASVMGTLVTNNLPTSLSGAHPGVIDWTTEVLVDLPGGELLETVTTEQIGWGQNWALIGDELVAFHEAEAQAGTEWKLRGLVRGMRYTLGAMDTHADGDRFVLLSGIGGLHGLYYDPVGGFAAGNRTYHFRVVPGGASIDAVETISTFVRGRSALPAAPILEPWQVQVFAGDRVVIEWARRSLDQATVFGPSPLQPGEFERFRVVVFDGVTMLGLLGTLGTEGAIAAAEVRTWHVGDESMGTPLVLKRVQWRNSEIVDDGFVLGVSLVGVVVYQVGPAGESERSAVQFFVPA